MSAAPVPEFLRPYFWDIDFDQLDRVVHARFIAERLMEKTTPKTFRWLMAQYSPAMLQDIVHQSRRLPPRDRTFWRLYLAQT